MTKELLISSSLHETKVAVLEDDHLVEVYYQRDTDVGLVGGIYKGRVSRVLPGMQSAFVDIGLERDAFLYVSDFIEDQEEYDRVLTETEARLTRGTEAAEPAAGSGGGAPAAVAETPVETGPGELPAERALDGAGAVTETGEQFPATRGDQLSATEAKPEPVPPAPVQPAPEARLSPAANADASVATAGTSGQSAEHQHRSERGSDGRRFDHRGRRRRHRGRGFRDSKFAPRSEFRERGPERSEDRRHEDHRPLEILPGESLAKYSQASTEGTSELPPTPPAVPGATEHAPEPVVTGGKGSAAAETERVHSQQLTVDEVKLKAPAVETVDAISAVPGEEADQFESESNFQPDSPVHRGSVDSVNADDAPLASFERKDEHEPPEMAGVASELPAPGEAGQPGDTEEAGGEGFAGSEDSSSLAPDQAEAGTEQERETASLSSEVAGSASAVPLGSQGQAGEAAPPAETAGKEAGGAASERSYTLRETHQRPRFAPRRGRRGRGRFGRRDSRPEGSPSPDRSESRPGNHQPVQINEVLREGQEILVQIAKEPLGTKGARITSHIALPGRYLVFMPTIEHIGVSRKISTEEERLRLRNIILENRGSLTGGFIVRTAAAGKSEEELRVDLRFLSTLWAEIRSRSERSKAPALIHRDLTLVQRILRDTLSRDFKTIRVDNEIEYEHAVEFVNRCQPSLVGHVKLYTRDTPMFEEFGIQQEIDKALRPKVWLKSGGYIVINQTEALVAIDVNTGKFVGKTNRLEDTIVKTNVDAVQEIVRQVRLRDLGGIIVIDFIDMDDRRNRIKVVQALEEALRTDRAPTKILSINEFGLVALTRKRVKQSLERTLCEPCPYCTGAGWIKSVSTICYEILAEVRKMARQIEGNTLTLRLNPEVARALKSREGVLISELETVTQKDVIIKSDPAVHQERFEIF